MTNEKREHEEAAFKSMLAENLELIDQLLIETNVELMSRPLHAATSLVRDGFIEIRGDTKEDFLGKQWFAAVFAMVLKWYQGKYGEAIEKTEKGFPGVVLIHGFPYVVQVPLTHGIPAEPGKSVWLSFELEVDEHETPRQWIEVPPSLGALSKGKATELDSDLRWLATSIRTINLRFMTAEYSRPKFDELRHASLLHLKNAASHIRENSRHSLALSAWDLNYALETAMKALIVQAGGTFSKLHNLKTLHADAERAGRAPFPASALKGWPKPRKVIDQRYGKPVAGGAAPAFKLYRSAIDLLVLIAGSVHVKLDFSRARLLIARPPWYDYLPEFRESSEGRARTTNSEKEES